jgi:hypothetical protein
MHLADSSEAFGDVSFSYAVTSAGLSTSSIISQLSTIHVRVKIKVSAVPFNVHKSFYDVSRGIINYCEIIVLPIVTTISIDTGIVFRTIFN